MAEDSLKPILYGKTAKAVLADGKEYILREPSIDTLESLDFDMKNIDEIKNIKKLVWLLLREDNPTLTEKQYGKLITLSMMAEGSPLMRAVLDVLGRSEKGK